MEEINLSKYVMSIAGKNGFYPDLNLEKEGDLHITYMEDMFQIFYPRRDGGYYRQPIEVVLDVFGLTKDGAFGHLSSKDITNLIMSAYPDIDNRAGVENIDILAAMYLFGTGVSDEIIHRVCDMSITSKDARLTISIVCKVKKIDYAHNPHGTGVVIARDFEQKGLVISLNGLLSSSQGEVTRYISNQEAKIREANLIPNITTHYFAGVAYKTIVALLDNLTIHDIL